MITFLPYPDFVKSADCLDWQFRMNRLDNQINEAIIIVQTLLGERAKNNHPVFLMWENYELTLVDYAWANLYAWECKKRRIDTRRIELNRLQQLAVEKDTASNKPFWLGDERLHSSHRAILLSKNYEWYKQFGWNEEPAIRGSDSRWPYFWPISRERKNEIQL